MANRDEYRPKTPPPLVRAQTAPPIRATPVPRADDSDAIPWPTEDHDSAAVANPEDQLARIEHRQRGQSQTVSQIAKLYEDEVRDRRARQDRAEVAALDLQRAKLQLEVEVQRAQMLAAAEERKRADELRSASGERRLKIFMAIVGLITTAITAFALGGGKLP